MSGNSMKRQPRSKSVQRLEIDKKAKSQRGKEVRGQRGKGGERGNED